MTQGVNYHPIDEGYMSHLVVNERAGVFELRIGDNLVRFNDQTAKDLVDLLTAYVQDRDRRQAEGLERLRTVGWGG